jgi:hypothetical protein
MYKLPGDRLLVDALPDFDTAWASIMNRRLLDGVPLTWRGIDCVITKGMQQPHPVDPAKLIQ